MWYIFSHFSLHDCPSITKVKSLKSVCKGDVRLVDDTEVSSEAYGGGLICIIEKFSCMLCQSEQD